MANFNNFFNQFKDEFSREFQNDYGQGGADFRVNFKRPSNPFRDVRSKKFLILIPIFIFAYFYIFLPPFNLRSYEFWKFFFASAVFSSLIIGPLYKVMGKLVKYLVLIGAIVGILHLTSMEIFHAKKYANILKVVDGNFAEDISEASIEKIPTIDRDSAVRIGNREMGELYDLVSQFNLDQSYTQINYKSTPVRVTPLEYNGILKWLTNFRQGIPKYMLVNMVNGEADLIPVENNIRYSHSDLFFRDIERRVRFSYPTKMIKDISFEIDETGRPFWVTPTYKPQIAWFGAPDVEGLILTDTNSGENTYYSLDEIPAWIDRAFESHYILQQLNWYGKYQSGFLNSVLAQQGVLQATAGYNYLAIGDDIYLYTGITSVAQDSSNIGFVMVNLRTKETKLYRLSSADEVSAMASAEGEVQEKAYQATFPILVNIKGKPTYFLSLKDNAGLIKMYAFVDAQNYQKVSTGNSVRAAYMRHLGMEVSEEEENMDQEDVQSKEGIIADIYSVVIGGNTHYYFMVEGDEKVYVTSIELSAGLPFLKVGDRLSFDYIALEDFNKLVNIK